MPKWKEKLVKQFVASATFYPYKSAKERKSIAWATATKVEKQRKRKKRR